MLYLSFYFHGKELVNHCLYEGREYSHGQVLPNTALCIVCLCYYGEIMCSNRKCPPLKIGCQRVNDPNDKCCSKMVCGMYYNRFISAIFILSHSSY